jgi:hypothetical protein
MAYASEVAGNGSEPKPVLAWESLVTDGHVRAARFRWILPWLIAIGIGLILSGFVVRSLPIFSYHHKDRDTLGRQAVIDIQKPAIDALSQLIAPKIKSDDSLKLIPPAKELPKVVKVFLDELNRSGNLPAEGIQIAHVDPKIFWSKEWPLTKLIATEADGVKVVGAVVLPNEAAAARSTDSFFYSQPEQSPTVVRWLGVFKKKDTRWVLISIKADGFVTVPGYEAAPIADIPLSIKPVLPVQE